jgi:hypothetical protein
VVLTSMLLIAGLAHADPGTADKLNLDDATVEQLDAIDGVGTDVAQAIVDLRTARGGKLSSVEELRILPGIEGDTLDALRSSTRVPIDATMGAQGPFTSADDVLAQFKSEPTVLDVQGWANEYSHASPELVDRWLRQSKLFAALPQVDLEYRLRTGYDFGYNYIPNSVDDPTDVLSVLQDAGEDADAYYTAKASWDLNELVMSSERIRVISEVQDVVKLRDKVLTEVTGVYFERRRLQVDMLLSPKADVRGQVIDQLRMMELTANIDALTGGRFSAAAHGS